MAEEHRRDWRTVPFDQMAKDEINEAYLQDLLMGNGSARFRWIDAREDRTGEPTGRAHAVLSVTSLKRGVRPPLDNDEPIVVFADDDESTQAARRALNHQGYTHVIAIPRGYPWVKRYLVEQPGG